MERIENNELKAALELFLNQSTNTFTFGRPEMYGKTGITLSQSDVEQLFDVLAVKKEKLHELYLNGVGIKEIPKSIGELSNLIILSLIYNKIENLPDEVCDLKELQILSLTSNKITHLPERIGVLEKLSWIDLNRNPIENLPDSITNLKNLEKLTLMNTGIKKEQTDKIEQLEQICKNTNNNSYGNIKDKVFYRNPKIYIDGIGLIRSQNKNVLSKHDFDNIIRGIPYPSSPKSPKTKGTKRKTLSTRRSPSPKPIYKRTKKSRKTPTPTP
jgi:Leucine-rich repeat (LRR) protein